MPYNLTAGNFLTVIILEDHSIQQAVKIHPDAAIRQRTISHHFKNAFKRIQCSFSVSPHKMLINFSLCFLHFLPFFLPICFNHAGIIFLIQQIQLPAQFHKKRLGIFISPVILQPAHQDFAVMFLVSVSFLFELFNQLFELFLIHHFSDPPCIYTAL